jgi:hypothetical protein
VLIAVDPIWQAVTFEDRREQLEDPRASVLGGAPLSWRAITWERREPADLLTTDLNVFVFFRQMVIVTALLFPRASSATVLVS